jgi:hypothetical protein
MIRRGPPEPPSIFIGRATTATRGEYLLEERLSGRRAPGAAVAGFLPEIAEKIP